MDKDRHMFRRYDASKVLPFPKFCAIKRSLPSVPLQPVIFVRCYEHRKAISEVHDAKLIQNNVNEVRESPPPTVKEEKRITEVVMESKRQVVEKPVEKRPEPVASSSIPPIDSANRLFTCKNMPEVTSMKEMGTSTATLQLYNSQVAIREIGDSPPKTLVTVNSVSAILDTITTSSSTNSSTDEFTKTEVFDGPWGSVSEENVISPKGCQSKRVQCGGQMISYFTDL